MALSSDPLGQNKTKGIYVKLTLPSVTSKLKTGRGTDFCDNF